MRDALTTRAAVVQAFSTPSVESVLITGEVEPSYLDDLKPLIRSLDGKSLFDRFGDNPFAKHFDQICLLPDRLFLYWLPRMLCFAVVDNSEELDTEFATQMLRHLAPPSSTKRPPILQGEWNAMQRQAIGDALTHILEYEYLVALPSVRKRVGGYCATLLGEAWGKLQKIVVNSQDTSDSQPAVRRRCPLGQGHQATRTGAHLPPARARKNRTRFDARRKHVTDFDTPTS